MKYISLEKFCTCTQTYQRYSNQIDPYPWQPESHDAIALLMTNILDPIIDHFGQENFQLTYGFCSIDLKKIMEKPPSGLKTALICPKTDQHCAHELNSRGNYICSRLGAAADFRITNIPMSEILSFIRLRHLPFDSIYYYGDNRPIHISYGPEHKRAVWGFKPEKLANHSF